MFCPKGVVVCEGRGLRWLGAARAQGGPRVADVYDWGEGYLDIERISPCAPTREAAYAFGAALARMHDAGAAYFGSAPDGYAGTCYFGPLQDPAPMDTGTWTDVAAYLAEILEGYQSVHPLKAGYLERRTLWQLYPIAGHCVFFGGGYVSEYRSMCRSLLATLR